MSAWEGLALFVTCLAAMSAPLLVLRWASRQ